MYVPTHFAQTDTKILHDFIEANSFGLLTSMVDGKLFASHLPFLLHRGMGPFGSLEGHVARANPQWQELDGQEVLAVFSGPHCYISPSCYEAENVVPTWNYVAVHAYGRCRLADESEAKSDLLFAMVQHYESGMPQPWTMERSSEFFVKLRAAVIGFRIDLTRLEGKWKLNQNHPAERREKVATVLAKSADPQAREISRLMRDGRD